MGYVPLGDNIVYLWWYYLEIWGYALDLDSPCSAEQDTDENDSELQIV